MFLLLKTTLLSLKSFHCWYHFESLWRTTPMASLRHNKETSSHQRFVQQLIVSISKGGNILLTESTLLQVVVLLSDSSGESEKLLTRWPQTLWSHCLLL